MNYRDFIDAMQEDDEQERRRRERLSRLTASKEEQPQGKRKNVVEQIGDVLNGVGGFVGGIVEDVKDSAVEAGGTIKDMAEEALDQITGASERKRKELSAKSTQNGKDFDEGKITLEEFNKRQKEVDNGFKELRKDFEESSLQKRDATKSAAAVADTFLNVASLGVGGVLKNGVKGGAKQIGKAVGKEVAEKAATETGKQVAKKTAAQIATGLAAEGAGFGGAQAVTYTLREKGAEATPEELARQAAIGTALGGVIGGGSSLLNKQVRQEAGQAIGRGRNAIQQQITDFQNMPRAVREGGYIRLPGAQAAEEAAQSTVPVTTRLDDELGKVATPGVNIKDSGLSSRAAPGEVDPVTGLRNNAVPGGLDAGRANSLAEYSPDTPISLTATERGVARGDRDPITGLMNVEPEPGSGVTTKTREQMKADNAPKRSFGKKLYEQFVDKAVDLQIYGKRFKEKYGVELPVEDDPYKLFQLRAGMDDAAAQKLSVVADNLEFMRANNLTDKVKEYGIANQVVNDRAGVYSPELVAAERAKLQRLHGELSPEQLSQVQAGTQSIIDKWDELVLRPLRDSGMLSPEAYDEMKRANPNYFTSFNLEKYIDHNQRRFSRSSSVNSPKNPIRGVKGISEGAVSIEDPFESLARHTLNAQKMIQDKKIVDAIQRLEGDFPDLGFTVREPDVVARRMELSLDNKELRRERDGLARALRRDAQTTRRLESQINQLEKRGLNLSLKNGGERMSSDGFAVGGLGGDVPTSKAGQLVDTPTNDATDLVSQLDSALKKTAKAQDNLGGLTKVEREARQKALDKASAVSDGLRQDVIAEGAGTLAETNASKLGKSDTRSFINNLIERGSQSDIDRIKKMVSSRDQKLIDLLDDISVIKSQYDEKVESIIGNVDDIQRFRDKQVPEGYEIISNQQNGTRRDVAVPQYIADILKGKNDIQIGLLEDMLRVGSKPFKAAATVFSPAFLVKNSMRDTFTNWLTSEHISKAERLAILPYAKRWVEALIDAWKGGEISQRVTAAGGGAAGVFNNKTLGVKGSGDSVVALAAAKISGQPIKDQGSLFVRAAKMIDSKNPVFGAPYRNAMTRVGRALEYAPRLAEAKAAIEKGLSDPAAAIAARQAIGDLQQGGTAAQLLNATSPFFNSIVQGNKRVVDAVRNNPQNAVAMLTAGVAVPTTTLYLWNRSAYPDVLNQIPEYERENNFIIILGDEKDKDGNFSQVLKIPKNEASKIFGNTLENGLKILADEQPDTFSEMFLKTLGYIQPVQVERDGKFSGSAMLGSLPIASNPVIKTPFELATNKSLFTGRDIVPEHLQGLPVEDQITEKTPVLDAAGARVTGLAPQQIGAVRQGVSASLLGGKNPIDQIKNVVSGTSGTRASNEFYQLRDEVSGIRKQASNAINKAIAANDIEAAQRIAARYNEIFQEKFSPWVQTYGPTLGQDESTAKMQESFQSLKLNLSTRSIKQRRKSLREQAQ